MFGKKPFGNLDLNKEAKAGRYYCASCGKKMKRHYSGHCPQCRAMGMG